MLPMSVGMSDRSDAVTPHAVTPNAGVPGSGVPADTKAPPPPEVGGPKESDPTRYGDWTVKGRCIDF